MLKVTSFYKFFPLKETELKPLQKKLTEKAENLNLKGLALLGEEGVNATFCGREKNIEMGKKSIQKLFGKNFFWKDSYCEKWNFRQLSVKVKKEIVSLGKTYPHLKESNQHLSPKEWDEKIKDKVQILDVRNSYEVAIGRFKGAKDLDINSFQDFPEKLDNLKMDKTRETLIYCTGGIRCEKAIELMKERNFKKVYQLEGGILNYFKDHPEGQFEEECFVFDHRVALDQKLQASKRYSLCPHCGQPGDLLILCRHCEKQSVVCKGCKEKSLHYETCSKNCAYHFKSGHQCHRKAY